MNLPPDVHAILATRHDLRMGIHRLRLEGELDQIRWVDLRFTEPEARELLDTSGIAISDAGVALLHRRTEGWAAGLRLAALSLAGQPDPERFVAEFSGSDRTVAGYLLAEMLERQPDEVQQLLLRTCLLDRVNGELADLLTGRPGSERILLELEDANAFVVSLDPERMWFRYHRLLADLLRLELRRRLPEEVPALDPPRRLKVAIASVKLALARRRCHLAGVTEQARFLACPVTWQSGEDIALSSDFRAAALMNLGIVEACLALPDAERHLRKGADLARSIGRPYLEVACLAHLA